jgi:hypothetical protein
MPIATLLRRFCLLAALCCGTCPFAMAAPACPATVPAGLSATPVSNGVVTSGLAMDISQVNGKEDVETILGRTEQAWKAAGLEPRRSSTVGWQVLAVQGNHCLLTLQLTKRDGSFGYLARSKPASSAPSAASMGVALPPGTKVDSSVASNDDGRQGVVVAAHSSLSLAQLSQYFMQQLGQANWSATRSHQVTDRSSGISTLFVTAQRDRQQVEIVAWPERGTQIVMTVAEAL